MRKTLHLCLSLLLLFGGVGLASAEETTTTVTFSDENLLSDGASDVTLESITKDYFSFTFSKGSNNSNEPKYYSNGSAVRIYKNNTMTVSALNDATITSIVITAAGTSNTPSTFSTDVGTYDTETYTWTGSTTGSVVFTPSAQVRMKAIAVTYTYTPKAITTTTTTLELDKSTMGLVVGNTGILTATLKDYQEAEITGQTITYSSSDEDIATVDENGTVTAKAVGKATITASFAGVTDTYDAANAECVVTVKRATVLGELVFNRANDAFASLSGVASYNSATYSFTADNGESYDFKLTNVLGTGSSGNTYLQLKASSGKIETSTFGFPDGYTAIISFQTQGSFTINDQSFAGTAGTVVTATITETTDKAITIEAGAKYGFVTKIEIIPNTPTYTLNDETSTLSDIEDVESGKNVKFNRTITTGWNAICLPFAVSADDLKTIFGENAKVDELTGSELNGTTQKLTFTTTDAITAGKPCLVYSDNELSSFTLASVEAPTTSITTEENTGNCTMKGAFVKTDDAIGVNDIYVNTGKLYIAKQAWAIKGFRSWIDSDEESGDGARNIEIVMDGTTTDISAATLGIETAADVYDLSGRKVVTPTKGVYVKNGKKMVIK